MRRVTVALVGIFLGTVLLVGLKAQGAIPIDTVAAAPSDPDVTGTPTVARTTQSAEETKTAAPTKRTAAPTASTKQPANTTTAPPAQRTILGDPVATVWHGDSYGTTQVKIIVTGTHIDDIIAVKQASRPKTTATTLRAQALQAQSADVGNVSGATASSNAYKQSLQSAIDKA